MFPGGASDPPRPGGPDHRRSPCRQRPGAAPGRPGRVGRNDPRPGQGTRPASHGQHDPARHGGPSPPLLRARPRGRSGADPAPAGRHARRREPADPHICSKGPTSSPARATGSTAAGSSGWTRENRPHVTHRGTTGSPTGDGRDRDHRDSGRRRLRLSYSTKVCHVRGPQAALTLLATIVATIVSRPAPDRAIRDSGQKSASGYRTSPILRDFPGFPIIDLSAEQVIIQVFSEQSDKLKIKWRSSPD